jgi:hypothetical protein
MQLSALLTSTHHLGSLKTGTWKLYNADLQNLLGSLPPDLIMGGDFTCVVFREDCRGIGILVELWTCGTSP